MSNERLPGEFFQRVAQLIFELDLSPPEFIDMMSNAYLSYISENVSSKRSDLVHYSKLGKYRVEQFIRNDGGESKGSVLFNNKVDSFLASLESSCKERNDYWFSRKEFVKLFHSVKLGSAGYSPAALLVALEKSGHVLCEDKGKINFLSRKPKYKAVSKENIKKICELLIGIDQP